MRLLFADGSYFVEHFCHVEKLVIENINQLVKDQQVIILASHFFDAKRPGRFRRLDVLRWIVCVPGKAVAHRVDLDAEFFKRFVLAVAVASWIS